MKRTHVLALGLVTVLMATAANAAPADRDAVQAPRDQQVQAPRERPDEVQAPRGQEPVQVPRGQELQSPNR